MFSKVYFWEKNLFIFYIWSSLFVLAFYIYILHFLSLYMYIFSWLIFNSILQLTLWNIQVRIYYSVLQTGKIKIKISNNVQKIIQLENGGNNSRVALHVLSHFSHVWFFAVLWTAAHQAPLSMGILQARMWERVAISFSKNSLSLVRFSPQFKSSPNSSLNQRCIHLNTRHKIIFFCCCCWKITKRSSNLV